MRAVLWISFWLRVASSVGALVLPIAIVTYPSGQREGALGILLLSYLLPSALVYSVDDLREFGAFLGMLLLTIGLIVAPVLRPLLGVTAAKRVSEESRDSLISSYALVVATSLFILGNILVDSRFSTTKIYDVLFGVILFSFSVDIVLFLHLSRRKR
jgi:hypothetical protein